MMYAEVFSSWEEAFRRIREVERLHLEHVRTSIPWQLLRGEDALPPRWPPLDGEDGTWTYVVTVARIPKDLDVAAR